MVAVAFRVEKGEEGWDPGGGLVGARAHGACIGQALLWERVVRGPVCGGALLIVVKVIKAPTCLALEAHSRRLAALNGA